MLDLRLLPRMKKGALAGFRKCRLGAAQKGVALVRDIAHI